MNTWMSQNHKDPVPNEYKLESITELFNAKQMGSLGVSYRKLKKDLESYLKVP